MATPPTFARLKQSPFFSNPQRKPTQIVQIDRCLCLGVTFRSIKETADRIDSTSIPELQAEVEFGTGCGLCRPYVREMLRTGETVFSRIITEDEDA